MASQVPPELIAAYERAVYRVFRGEGSFVLKVGVRSKELAELLSESGRQTACFITAWHPHSEPASVEANARAQAALKWDLKRAGGLLFDGIGEDPAGRRPGEPSFLALGLSLPAARSLGEKYRQNAVVWSGPDALPVLILLR